MTPLTLLAMAVIVILIGWLIFKIGLDEPWRSLILGILVVALLLALLRLLGWI